MFQNHFLHHRPTKVKKNNGKENGPCVTSPFPPLNKEILMIVAFSPYWTWYSWAQELLWRKTLIRNLKKKLSQNTRKDFSNHFSEYSLEGFCNWWHQRQTVADVHNKDEWINVSEIMELGKSDIGVEGFEWEIKLQLWLSKSFGAASFARLIVEKLPRQFPYFRKCKQLILIYMSKRRVMSNPRCHV